MDNKRRCRICGHKLSTYNKLDQCWHHEYVKGTPETIYISRDIPTICTSGKDIGLLQELIEKGVCEDKR